MTSAEITASKSTDLTNLQWLREIALQLALTREGSQPPNPVHGQLWGSLTWNSQTTTWDLA